MFTPSLKTENYLIRAFKQQDLEKFANYRSQEVVAKYQNWTNFSYQDAIEFFERMDYSAFGTVGKWYQLAIVKNGTGELVGDLAIHFIDQDQIEIGFTISPQYQRQSVATEAVAGLLEYVFNVLNKHRVIATTDVANKASYGLLEKLGFRREGHFIQNIFFKGAWGDEYHYALLNTDPRFRSGSEGTQTLKSSRIQRDPPQ